MTTLLLLLLAFLLAAELAILDIREHRDDPEPIPAAWRNLKRLPW